MQTVKMDQTKTSLTDHTVYGSRHVSKRAGIMLVTASMAFLFWYTSQFWVHSRIKFSEPDIWIGPLVSMTLLATLICLCFIILPSRTEKMIVSGTVGGLYLVVFGIGSLTLLASMLIFICYLWASKRIGTELGQRIKINVIQVVRPGLNLVVLPLMLALSFAYFLSPVVQVQYEEQKIPLTLKQVISATVNTLISDEQEEQPHLGGEITDEVIAKLLWAARPYQKYTPPLLAFGLLIILWGISFILNFISSWLAALIFWMFRRFNFVRFDIVQVHAESIRL